jgi:hypothetical protein
VDQTNLINRLSSLPPEIGPHTARAALRYHGEWYGFTPSRTGIFLSLAGYFGLKIGWVEGIELNLLGGVIGIDVRRPAIKLPAIGRLGMQLSP